MVAFFSVVFLMENSNFEQSNFRALDAIAIFSSILQIFSYTENLKQTSNDYIYNELRKQDSEYLAKILEGQKEIKQKLDKVIELLEVEG